MLCAYVTNCSFIDLSGLPNGELSAELRNLLKEMSSASKGAVKPLQLKVHVEFIGNSISLYIKFFSLCSGIHTCSTTSRIYEI